MRRYNREMSIETYLEKEGFELTEEATDVFGRGITVYEQVIGDELTEITINVKELR